MAVKKYMVNIPRMETFPMFCILLLVGLPGKQMEIHQILIMSNIMLLLHFH